MCENGEKIVSTTDSLVTYAGITADMPVGKFRWLNDWLITFAGSTGNAGLFLEELRIIDEKAGKEAFARERIQETLRNAYNAFRSKECSHSVLGPLGITLEDLNRYGVKRFGEGVTADLQRRMDEYCRQYISDQFLVSGWGSNPNGAMTFLVGPDSTAADDVTGCMTSGSGGEVALSTLLLLRQHRSASLSETLYRVAAAKFMSERSADEYVGQNTTIFISWQRGGSDRKDKPAGRFVSEEIVNELRSIWVEHGRPKIPEEGALAAARAIGEMGLSKAIDIAVHMQAFQKLYKKSVSLNAEEDDPDSSSSNEKDGEAPD